MHNKPEEKSQENVKRRDKKSEKQALCAAFSHFPFILFAYFKQHISTSQLSSAAFWLFNHY